MTAEQSLVAFFVTAGVVTITPGLDTALVVRTSAAEGPKSAAGAGLGVAMGLLCWGAVVAVGLGGLLAASQLAYTALRWLGAAYLCYLGIKLVLKPRTGLGEVAVEGGRGFGSWLGKGFCCNVLNPKIGVFYVTFLPQFVPEHGTVGPWLLAFAAIHAGQAIVWFAALIAATAPLGRFLGRPKVVRNLDRMTGGVFIAFGAKLALARD